MLPPEALYERWDLILRKAIGFVQQLRDDQLDTTPPDRPRSLRDLCYHVFTIGRIYKRAYDEDVRESWQGMMDPAPPDCQTAEAMARNYLDAGANARAAATPLVSAPTAAGAAAPNAPTEFVRVKARAGVLDSANYDPGIVTTPISANFSMKQQMIFDFQIPKALELFEQLRNRRPNSHQEFMREIIQKGNVRLPTLPRYYRYIYDPEVGEFFIERPANAD